ncbi:MAG: hypothetical protein M1833_000102 [Piccolia ochrophora]|nr:MAG: hypothetical protein M1833_000102 [Piccolia ochrophora]
MSLSEHIVVTQQVDDRWTLIDPGDHDNEPAAASVGTTDTATGNGDDNFIGRQPLESLCQRTFEVVLGPEKITRSERTTSVEMGKPDRTAPVYDSMLATGAGTPHHTAPLYSGMQGTASRLLDKYCEMPLFRADLGEDRHIICSTFVNGLPAERRQLFNCTTCKHLMGRFGNIVMVDPATGGLLPIFWDPDSVPSYYQNSVGAVAKLFQQKKVLTEFRLTSSTKVAGFPEKKGFAHMSFDFSKSSVPVRRNSVSSHAKIAESATMLERIIQDNEPPAIRQAGDLLFNDELPYAAKFKGAMRWLDRLVKTKPTTDRIYLHMLRSGALSTLLSAIKEGWTPDAVRDRWERVAMPGNYMRPTTAPTVGSIAAAEQLFSELDLTEHDLRRAFLSPRDIPSSAVLYHHAKASPPRGKGIFRNVVPKRSIKPPPHPDESRPPPTITFTEFALNVLPLASSLSYLLRPKINPAFLITGLQGTYPLMQWHTPTNLASWYIFDAATRSPSDYSLRPGHRSSGGVTNDARFVRVSRIISFPNLWSHTESDTRTDQKRATTAKAIVRMYPNEQETPLPHAAHGITFLVCLEGIREVPNVPRQLALFPSFMRGVLHGVRKVLERYSEAGVVEMPEQREGDKEEQFVGRIRVAKGEDWDVHVFGVEDVDGGWKEWKVVGF